MDELNIHHFLSTLNGSDESNFLRLSQVRLIIAQTLNELLGEKEQNTIQIAKANRLMSAHPEGSEDYLIWLSIKMTAERNVPILEQRVELIELHKTVIEDLYLDLTGKGLTLQKCIQSLSIGVTHDHNH